MVGTIRAPFLLTVMRREKNVTLAIAREFATGWSRGRVRVAADRDSESSGTEERYGIGRAGSTRTCSMSDHADAGRDELGFRSHGLHIVRSRFLTAKLQSWRARKQGQYHQWHQSLAARRADVSSIPDRLTQREPMKCLADFAIAPSRSSRQLTFRKNSRTAIASFVVLKGTRYAVVLFETGYLTNKDDVAFLNSRQGRPGAAVLRRSNRVGFRPETGDALRKTWAGLKNTGRSHCRGGGAFFHR